MKNSPVFIVGCPRTGSTTLQSIINKCTDYAMLPEAHFLSVWYLRKDFCRIVEDEIGSINTIDRKKQLVTLMFSKKLFGQFWEYIDKQKFSKIFLEEEMARKDSLTIRNVINTVLVTYMKSNKKTKYGAKFPVHVKYTHRLIEWFPECLIMHTVRDPRGIYSSQYYKHGGGSSSKIKNIYIGVIQFIHISINFYQSAVVHRKHKKYKNYRLFRYENLVIEPESYMKNMCEFIGIASHKALLESRVPINSSYKELRSEAGSFQTKTIDAWRTKIPSITAKLLVIANYWSMKELGYR